MKRMDISDNTAISMPVRNMLAIIGAVGIGVWSYFGITEKLNQHSTTITLMKSDLEKNTEFRIKWPRGEMGSLPADSEQFMLIEHLAKEFEKLQAQIENGQAPYDQQQKLTLEFYEKRITSIEENIEKLRNGSP